MVINIIVSALIVFFAVFMIVWGIRVKGRGEFFDDCFSAEQTRSIKGMCAVFILYSHLCTYLADTFKAFFLFKYVGAIMVAGFFLVSGYGLQYSVMNKKDYMKGFLKKRLLSVMLPYYIINIFYIVTTQMKGIQIIKSLFGYTLWYIMVIAVFYVIFYMCNLIFVKKKAPAAITVCVIAFMVIMSVITMVSDNSEIGPWWYISALSFPLGIWLCICKEHFMAFAKRHWGIIMLCLLAVFSVTFKYYCGHLHEENIISPLISVINTTAFSMLLFTLSMKVQFKNKILYFTGGLSLELYLIHALWITWLRNGFWYNVTDRIFDSDILYLAGIVIGTVAFSVLVHVFCSLLLRGVKRKDTKTIENSVNL